MNHYLNLFELQTPQHLRNSLENKVTYEYEDFQVNVFETFVSSTHVKLQYDGLSISSMIRGKKVIHSEKNITFDFLPGTSVLIPKNEVLFADFPDADEQNPVQCATILISPENIEKNINFLNEYYPNPENPWKFDFENFHFNNSSELTHAINDLLKTCIDTNKDNSTLSDLLLKTLLVRIIEAQRKNQKPKTFLSFPDQLFLVKHYIKQNISQKITIEKLCRIANCSRSTLFRLFLDYCGNSPGDYIKNERINLAKNQLLNPANNISDVAYLCGFGSVSYFVNIFKKETGQTPGEFIKKYSALKN